MKGKWINYYSYWFFTRSLRIFPQDVSVVQQQHFPGPLPWTSVLFCDLKINIASHHGVRLLFYSNEQWIRIKLYIWVKFFTFFLTKRSVFWIIRITKAANIAKLIVINLRVCTSKLNESMNTETDDAVGE